MTKAIAFFLKVTKTEYLNDLTQNGELYLSLAESFRDRKCYGGKKYDSEEGSLSNHYKLFVNVEGDSFCNPDALLDLSHAKTKGNECIYCLKTIYRDEVKNGILIPFGFLNDLIDKADWSEYSLLIIKNPVGFLDCIEQAAIAQDYTYLFKPVMYDNHVFDCPPPLFSDETAIETYFHKRKIFREQTEYRILLQNRIHKDLILNIGTDFFTDKNYLQIDDLQPLKDAQKSILLK